MTLYVVTGPPCAGKSTWVMQKANSEDIVIDFDRLAVALSGNGKASHGHDGAIDYVTSAVRTAAIDEILNRKHYLDVDVYLIHSNPSRGALGTYQFHGANVVQIDPGRETVEARCRSERPAEAMEGVRKFYESRRSSRMWT